MNVKIKFKLGWAMDLLCLAGAGALAMHSLIKLDEWIMEEKHRKEQDELTKVVNEGEEF